MNLNPPAGTMEGQWLTQNLLFAMKWFFAANSLRAHTDPFHPNPWSNLYTLLPWHFKNIFLLKQNGLPLVREFSISFILLQSHVIALEC